MWRYFTLISVIILFFMSADSTEAQQLNCSRFEIAIDKDTGQHFCVGTRSGDRRDTSGGAARSRALKAEQKARTEALIQEQEQRTREQQSLWDKIYQN